MGMKIFEQSGTFAPASFGLKAGSVLDIICVGGGSSGCKNGGVDSISGGNSSFGSYVSSANGAVMGYGEKPTASGRVGCGAGGYLPGVGFYGGNGGSPVGLAGTSETPVSPYCNPGGNGNKGATGGYVSSGSGQAFAPAGNGYGAGGGGARDSGSNTYNGGDAGKIAFGSAVLPSTSNITVTVGAGGVNAADSDLHGAPGVVIVFW